MEYGAITLDTSIFNKHGLKLEQGLLKALEQFRDKPAGLVLSEIIIRELTSHLKKKASEAGGLLEKAIKESSDYLITEDSTIAKLKELSENLNPQEVAVEKITNFLRNTGADVIRTEAFLNIQKLIERYFNSEPPFSEAGKKKNEFPDAMTLLTLEEYARNKKVRILAVSTDEDWVSFANNSEWIFVEKDLAKAIAQFQPQNEAYDYCERISDEFEEPDSYLLAKLSSFLQNCVAEIQFDTEAACVFQWEPVQIDLILQRFDFNSPAGRAKLYPIESDKNTITIETKITLHSIAEGEFSLYVYDSMDKENFYVGVAKKDISFSLEASLLIQVKKFTEEERVMFGIDIEKIEMNYQAPLLDFGNLEATWHNESNY